jgi:predicted transcriptional regulator
MKLTDAEWQVMNALWDGHPATTREILERLPTDVDWAYTTVKTMLTRLEGKGAVKARKQGKTTHYTPAVTRSRARGWALADLANRAFDGAMGPLVHFLVGEGKLSESEREELAELLADEDGRNEDDPQS